MSQGRKCNGCTLCCKLLPQVELSKPANQRCKHQRGGRGCAIYAGRPPSCRMWSCAWLIGPDTADLRRPDHVHYVIDMMPDYVTARAEGQEDQVIPVVQVWVDPRFPDAHQEAGLRAYLARRGEVDGMAALIRYGSNDGFVLFPPALTPSGDWHESRDGIQAKEHSAEEKFAAAPELMRRAVEEMVP